MNIEAHTYLVEALIRFDKHGLKGAHQIFEQELVDTETGELLSVRALDAQPVEASEIVDLIGSHAANMQAQIMSLGAENKELTERLAKLVADLDTATSNLNSITAERDELKAFKDQIEAERAAKEADPTLSAVDLRNGLLALGITAAQIDAVLEVYRDAEGDAAYEALTNVWEYTVEFHRSDPRIDQFGGLLGLSSNQIDTLFGVTPTGGAGE